MNHTHEHTHVSCHDYSHSFHHKTLFFSPCCKPCKLLCCVLHRFTHTCMLCRFELFFLGYSAFTGLPLSQLFLLCLYSDSFSLCLVLHVQVTLPSISLVVIIVSAQNGSMSCQTHALHCMLISHGLLYMVMSKGLHVTDVDVFHTCNWTVCCMYWTGVSGVGSTGVVGGKCHNTFVRGPREAPLYMSHIPFTVLKLGGF